MQTIEQPAPSVLKLLAHDLRWTLLQQLTQSDYRVAELVAQVKQPLNLVSYHLRQLRQAGLVHERRSTADERSFYYSLDLQRLHLLYLEASSSLHPSLGEAIPPGSRTDFHFDGPPPRLLFLCTSKQRPLSDGRGAGGTPEPGTGPGVQCRESSSTRGQSVGDPHACPTGHPDEPARAQILGAVCGSVV